MTVDAVGHTILTTSRIVLAVALFAGILGAFHAQRGQWRRALAGFRQVRPTGEGEVFFVRHASEQNLADRSRAFAGDAFGALTVTPRAVVFHGDPEGSYPSVEFLLGQSEAAWVGRRMTNGAFSWFSITARGETHYFTSAERMGTIGSRKRTRKIHDAVLARLG
jgi:hypothetical protein